MEIKSHFKMYGNMSSVEKAFNKADLRSYKNYDNRQHSLVPGLQHHKHIASPLGQAGRLQMNSHQSPGQDSRNSHNSRGSPGQRPMHSSIEAPKLYNQ